MQQNSSTKAG